LTGAAGLLMRSNELGAWMRIAVPPVMAHDSIVSVSEAVDGRLAVLGSLHVAILDSLGRLLRVEPLSGSSKPLAVLIIGAGATATVYADRIRIETVDGTPIDIGTENRLGGLISTWVALTDGRLVVGTAADAANPFAVGALLVVAANPGGHSAARSELVSTDRQRSGITALGEENGYLRVCTLSGCFRKSVDVVPLRDWSSRNPLLRHRQ